MNDNPYLLLFLLLFLSARAGVGQSSPASTGNYQDLTSLFSDWRAFEEPPLRDGAPDYTAETFERREQGYGASYITGKYLVENALAEFARIKELKGESFHIKDFFDRLNAMGNIPIALGHWEMTGDGGLIRDIVK